MVLRTSPGQKRRPWSRNSPHESHRQLSRDPRGDRPLTEDPNPLAQRAAISRCPRSDSTRPAGARWAITLTTPSPWCAASSRSRRKGLKQAASQAGHGVRTTRGIRAPLACLIRSPSKAYARGSASGPRKVIVELVRADGSLRKSWNATGRTPPHLTHPRTEVDMGMISCRDCGKVLSRSAKRCPLCGAIKPGRSSVEYYLHPGRQPGTCQRQWDTLRD